jgi:hypothetical protein
LPHTPSARYAYLSKDALVYRHVKSATAEPTGAEKAIPYASLEEVKAPLPAARVVAAGA